MHKPALTALLLGMLAVGCSGTSAQKPPEPAPVAATPQSMAVVIKGTTVRLPGGWESTLPKGTQSAGTETLVLVEVPEEAASIGFVVCSASQPAENCVGNHREVKSRSTRTVSGVSAPAFLIEATQPAAAGDPRVWQELHTILPVSGELNIDIVGRVMQGSGREGLLDAAYAELITHLHRR